MTLILALVLPSVLSVIMSVTASLLWWKTFANPATFGVVAFLAMIGLHRALQAFSEFLKSFTSGGYFLEFREKPDLIQLAKESLNLEALVTCVLLVALGIPLLYWLRSAMVKA
jgi:hypothetical protein